MVRTTPLERPILVRGKCNNNCLFCPANGLWDERPRNDILKEIALVSRDGRHQCHFTGGELTVRRDLKSLLAFMRRLGLPWSLATNGRYFAQPGAAQAFREAGLAAARVSLHGPRSPHNEVTGAAGFDQTTEGISRLTAAGVAVKLSTVVTRILLEESSPEEFAGVVSKLGTFEVRLAPPVLNMLAVTGDHECKRQNAKCKVQNGHASWLSATIDHRPSAFAGRFGGTSSTVTYDRRLSRSCFDDAIGLRGDDLRPGLAPARDWVVRFAECLAGRGGRAVPAGFPHCALPAAGSLLQMDSQARRSDRPTGQERGLSDVALAKSGPRKRGGGVEVIAERRSGILHGARGAGQMGPVRRPGAQPAWPCEHCARRPRCGGFDIGTWQPGSLDLLSPASPSHPGHLRFRRARSLRSFKATPCPVRAGRMKPPSGPAGMIVAEGERASLWIPLPPIPDDPVLLEAKLVFGQIWLAGADSNPLPLELDAQCQECSRLHECPALFRPSEGAAAMPAPDCLSSRSCLEAEPSRRDQPDFEEAVLAAAAGAPVQLAAPVREIWLVEEGAETPVRPQPSDPVQLVRSFTSRGLVPLAYSLPAAGRRGPFRVELAAEDNVPDPLFVRPHRGASIQITESCMCRCLMCNIVGYFKRPVMPLTEALRAIEELGLLGVGLVDLFGGEVTLRDELVSLIRHVRRLGMSCMFITTGYYVTPRFVRILAAAGLTRVVVSIDGSRPEIHDPVRQLPGIYRRAVRAMKALAKEPRIETFASTVILSENLEDLSELVRQTGRIGLKKHEFFFPISGPISSTRPRWPTREQAEQFFDRILPEMEATGRQYGVEVDFRPEIRAWDVPREEAIRMLSQGNYNIHAREVSSRCLAPGFNVFITVNGGVYPCDMPSIIHKDTALGNLAQHSLLELLTSPAMRRYVAQAGQFDACRMCVGRYEAVR
jgi:MoaA/NifB/PqqE/SkfB family radical SAM enzyme